MTRLRGDIGNTSGSATTATSAVIGGGMEFLIASNLSAKLEYLHIYDPGVLITDPDEDGVGVGAKNNDFDVVRVGINYRF